MRIRDLEFFAPDLCDGATGSLSTLVCVSTDQGLVGWGETTAGPSRSSLRARRQSLLPLLAGCPVFAIEEFLREPALVNLGLAQAVEMACWDLIGRSAQQPLCHLWGGAYRSQIPLAARVRQRDVTLAGNLIKERAAQGIHVQVVTAGGNLRDDIAMLTHVCHEAGERTEIWLDADKRFTIDDARELGAQLEDLPVTLLIDPIIRGQPAELASLRRQIKVPLAARRGLTAPRDLLHLTQAGAVDQAILEPAVAGGIAATRQCVAIAAAANLDVSLLVSTNTGIATAAMLQLAAALPAINAACECDCPLKADSLLSHPPAWSDGLITVPTSPGLGIEPDADKLEDDRVE